MKHFLAFMLRNTPVILLVTCLCTFTAVGQDEDEEYMPLFESNEMIDVTLAFDQNAVLSDVSEDPRYHAATVTYAVGDSTIPLLPVRIQTRGGYRRLPENCGFPPLRLNFRKKYVEGSLFANQDKLKLVTHCNNDDPEAEQKVVLEYLAYRALNEITPESYRVRLVRMTYNDIADNNSSVTRLAFIIEDDGLLAKRLNAEVEEEAPLERKEFDRDALAKTFLFEYMIGNRDWQAYPYRTNMDCIRRKRGGDVVAIPYDFDFAHLVGHTDEDEKPAIGSTALRHETMFNLCLSAEELAEVVEQFRSERNDIVSLFERNALLENEHKERAVAQVSGFFELLENDFEIEREFVRPCRGEG